MMADMLTTCPLHRRVHVQVDEHNALESLNHIIQMEGNSIQMHGKSKQMSPFHTAQPRL